MALTGIQQQPSNFFHDLFAPLPEGETPAAAPRDGFDRAADYFKTTSGAWDLFRVFDHAMQYLLNLPNLSEGIKGPASKISKVSNLAGIGLSVPAIFSDLNGVRKKAGALMEARGLPYGDPLRHRKLVQAGKGMFLDTMSLTNTASQAALFLNEAKLINLAQYLPVVDGLYQGSSFISDSIELAEQAYKLDSYGKAQPHNAREASEIEEKKWLSWMIIVKDVASIALAAIALVGLAFGIAIFSTPAMAAVALGLSTIWLVMKITTYFYDEIIQDRRRAAPALVTV